MKRFISVFFAIILINLANAQIGYQVSLIDNATGEPRANEKVEVKVELSYNGGVLLTENKSVSTNDFGIISLTVGNDSTFKNFDWNKLPIYISATIDGTLIGRSQILTVPIAEHAKHIGTLTKEQLCSKVWEWEGIVGTGSTPTKCSLIFNPDSSAIETKIQNDYDGEFELTTTYYYSILGNYIFLHEKTITHNGLHYEHGRDCDVFEYIPESNSLLFGPKQYQCK